MAAGFWAAMRLDDVGRCPKKPGMRVSAFRTVYDRSGVIHVIPAQVNKAAGKRLSLSGLEVLHGRLTIETVGGDFIARQICLRVS